MSHPAPFRRRGALIRFLPAAPLLTLLAGCAAERSALHYVVTTDNSNTCCRTMRYDVADFPNLLPGSGGRPGEVDVRLLDDSVGSACGGEIRIPLTITNNSGSDVYIPVSHELQGETIKLYPWILLLNDGAPVRVARQIQYGDLLERTDSRLVFRRIPAGHETRLTGLIPREWLCKPEIVMGRNYLQDQLDPKYWSDHTRALRTPAFWNEPQPVTPVVGLRYDVVFTTLDFTSTLPRKSEQWSAGNDTLALHLTAKEEPASFVNGSQRVAESNIVTMMIEGQ